MDILRDTHTLLWMLMDDPRLKPSQFQVLESPQNRIFVSAVTAFEIATKAKIGKLSAGTVVADFDLLMARFDYQPLPISHRHGLRGGSLPGPHRDPFDRLLAAQSLVEGMPLMTDDPAFKGFGVECVW